MAIDGARKPVVIVVGVLVTMAVLIGIGFVLRTTLSADTTRQASDLAALGDGFPAPNNARVAVPSSSGSNPPSNTRSWESDTTLEDACGQWREAFRQWASDARQQDLSGSVEPGISCTFAAKRNGNDVTLQVAKVGETKPVATLNIVGAEGQRASTAG